MFTTIAALVVVLGLMASLARYVRNELAVEASKDTLHRLDTMLEQYMAGHGGLAPKVPPFLAPMGSSQPVPDEAQLLQRAEVNNRALVKAFRNDGLLTDRSFPGLPATLYDDFVLRDAWGTPIVFMPTFHEAIGMAPRDQPFFFSAGQDGKFLTLEDNLYSYER
jgi:hypothetical protein